MTENYAYFENKTLEDIRAIHRRTLALLAGQAAGFGQLYVPSLLHHQIEHAKAAIDEINRELARRGIQTTEPPPGASVPAVGQQDRAQGDGAAGSSSGSVSITGGSVHGPVAGVIHGAVQYVEAGHAPTRLIVSERGL